VRCGLGAHAAVLFSGCLGRIPFGSLKTIKQALVNIVAA